MRKLDGMLECSPEALFRYQVISQVFSRIIGGQRQVEAVAAVAAMHHRYVTDGTLRVVSSRSIYRWLRRYKENDLASLEPRQRPRSQKASTVLPDNFVKFLREEKKLDPTTSIPEIIRTAGEKGIIKKEDPIDRVTVYRTAKKLRLPVAHRRATGDRDARRFAFPHRMDSVLCDGKHFRAGEKRARRVALFFIDDATRFGLHVVVGTSENATLFQRGLYMS